MFEDDGIHSKYAVRCLALSVTKPHLAMTDGRHETTQNYDFTLHHTQSHLFCLKREHSNYEPSSKRGP